MTAVMHETPQSPAVSSDLAPHRKGGLLVQSWSYTPTKVGLVLVVLMILVAVLGPWLAPHEVTDFVDAPLSPPSDGVILGTDLLGRDVLSQVLSGGKLLLIMALASTAVGVLVGTFVGLAAGYIGGRTDDLIMRTMDVVHAFPYIVLALLFVALLGAQPWLIVVLVAIGWVPGVARTMRGATMDVAGLEFVEAAEVMGASRASILYREILPNVTSPFFVEFALRLTWSVGAIAALSFLGFGVQPPATDWGLMINENRNGLSVNPWAVLGPVLCVAVFAVGTNLLADGLGRAAAGIDRKSAAS